MFCSYSYYRDILPFAVISLSGLVAGYFVAVRVDSDLLVVMRLAAECRVSIVGSFLTAVLPFLIAAYAVMIHNNALLYVASLARGFGFGCVAWLTVRAFGTAAWLIQPLLQFTDGIMFLIYLLFGVRVIRGGCKSLPLTVLLCVISAAAVSVYDYLAVSPFLASLLLS